MDEIKKKALASLKACNPPLCVLSTVSPDGKSESSLLAYVVNDDLSLLVSTGHTTRKWSNLEKNPSISIVFGLTFGVVNVQYEGTAELVPQGAEFDKCQEQFFTALPQLKQYRSNDTGMLKIKPTWIRTNDYSQTPHKIEEASF